ncbi:MAG: hypothetical protein JWR16_1546 [Nevskia sp.]|nr:hypothetical protein [Nevskia sp.]
MNPHRRVGIVFELERERVSLSSYASTLLRRWHGPPPPATFLLPWLLVGLLSGLLLAAPLAVRAAELDRQLELKIDIEGQQTWKNALQSSKGSTKQHYELVTRLRTDGKLQGANLLDPDFDRRMAIKQEFLKRKGLEQAKRNGAVMNVPHTEEEKRLASAQVQQDMYKCNGDPDCMSSVVERYSAIFAQAAEDSEKPGKPNIGAQLLDQPGRYLFFFGYDGCPNRIHAVQTTHIEGEQAFDKAKKNLVPFSLQRDADSSGNAADQKSLCRRYTIVVDTEDNKIFVENVYLPSPLGVSVSTLNGHSDRQERELPLVEELLDWLTQTLKTAKASGNASATLRLTRPFDGNASVGGLFDGAAKVTLSWSFLPVTTTP